MFGAVSSTWFGIFKNPRKPAQIASARQQSYVLANACVPWVMAAPARSSATGVPPAAVGDAFGSMCG